MVQSLDSSFTHLHLHATKHADLFEDFSKPKLPVEDIMVPEHLKPGSADDEEDIVPDQRAAFGIQRATQKTRQPAWRDHGLTTLMTQGPLSNTRGNGNSTQLR